MKKSTEACSPSTDNLSVAHGSASNGQVGIVEELIWTAEDFRFNSIAEVKDEATLNAGIAAGKVIVLGKVKPESKNTDATFAEDAELGEKELDTEAIRATGYQGKNCACTHAELVRMNGINGRIIERTKKGFAKLRYDTDGKIMGMLTSDFYVGLKTTPVAGTPIAYTPIDATFDDAEGDDAAPCEVKIGYSFKDLDKVNRAEGTVDTVAADGTNFTFNLTLTQGCSDEVVTGAAVANLKIEDSQGNDIPGLTAVEAGATGVYAINATTAEVNRVRISVDGVQLIGEALFTSDQIAAATT